MGAKNECGWGNGCVQDDGDVSDKIQGDQQEKVNGYGLLIQGVLQGDPQVQVERLGSE